MSKQTQTFTVPHSVEETYAALKAALDDLHYTVDAADDAAHALTVKTRVSAFSWGEVIHAGVASAPEGGSVVTLASEPKLKTNVVDMGRGKRELAAIANALTAKLDGDNTLSQPADSSVDAVADEIRKLAALKEEGLLTEEEFSAKKKQLLGI